MELGDRYTMNFNRQKKKNANNVLTATTTDGTTSRRHDARRNRIFEFDFFIVYYRLYVLIDIFITYYLLLLQPVHYDEIAM